MLRGTVVSNKWLRQSVGVFGLNDISVNLGWFHCVVRVYFGLFQLYDTSNYSHLGVRKMISSVESN